MSFVHFAGIVVAMLVVVEKDRWMGRIGLNLLSAIGLTAFNIQSVCPELAVLSFIVRLRRYR